MKNKEKKFNPKHHWKGMPEFVQENVNPVKSIIVHFDSKEEMLKLSKIIGQEINAKTKYIHLPFRKAVSETDHRWSDKKK
jgi:hypothetical protein